ncbi:MAG TPA: hypothetical protein DDZ66_12050 [Firmicutes bacterium]|nr:hypothetical protein [Bacillota bacterium]
METLKFTLRIMKKRPLRSLLTILQMGLGVWIVAIILSLNFQASGSLDSINQVLGDSLAKISVSKEEQFEGGVGISTTSNLRLSDLERLLESEYIDAAFIYQEQWQLNIMVDGVAYSVSQSAETTSDYAQGMNLELVEGQFFTATDQRQENRVVLISEVIASQLFPNQSPVGRMIELGDYTGGKTEFEIIGVYKPQSPLLEFFMSPAHLIFPLGITQPSWFFEGDYEPTYMSIVIRAKPGQVYEAVADAQVLLADRSLDEMTIRGEYFQDSNRFFSDQICTITLFLGAFAFIAILISAIGILSIMLVSVVERTREVGLRQALGASKGIIIRQVLNESFVFSAFGAVLGLVVAYFTTERLMNLLLLEMTYPRLSNIGGLHPHAAWMSLVLALMMGLIFGFYPALQAAKMPPVEALKDS